MRKVYFETFQSLRLTNIVINFQNIRTNLTCFTSTRFVQDIKHSNLQVCKEQDDKGTHKNMTAGASDEFPRNRRSSFQYCNVVKWWAKMHTFIPVKCILILDRRDVDQLIVLDGSWEQGNSTLLSRCYLNLARCVYVRPSDFKNWEPNIFHLSRWVCEWNHILNEKPTILRRLVSCSCQESCILVYYTDMCNWVAPH